MDTSASERSVRLPTFDGDEKNFQLWWMRFCAYARVYKFASAAKRVRDSNLPLREDETIDVTTDPGKQRAEAKRANDVCMANLTMAFTSEKLMGLVYKATTTAWPSGQAYLVIDALFKRYVPQDLISKVELRREVNKVSMKKEEDPANLFEALSAIENKYNTAVFQIQSDELIATVLEKAPREYMSVLTTEQRVQGTRLTMNHLEEAMTQLYRSLYGSGSEEKGDEIGLSSVDSSGVVCYRCKEKGHKAYECPKKNNGSKGGSSGKKFKGKCNSCGKQGHKAADCWSDPKNASKVPEWYKKKANNGEAGMLNTDTEVLLSQFNKQMEFPRSLAILMDPNVWVGDTGASVDSTYSKAGATNVREATVDDSVTNGNGSKTGITHLADISGTICDKYGNQMTKAKMKDVKIAPGNKFNLFSITKRQKNGWKLMGDNNAIWLEKNGVEI